MKEEWIREVECGGHKRDNNWMSKYCEQRNEEEETQGTSERKKIIKKQEKKKKGK